jgi:hypothetical protein
VYKGEVEFRWTIVDSSSLANRSTAPQLVIGYSERSTSAFRMVNCIHGRNWPTELLLHLSMWFSLERSIF